MEKDKVTIGFSKSLIFFWVGLTGASIFIYLHFIATHYPALSDMSCVVVVSIIVVSTNLFTIPPKVFLPSFRGFTDTAKDNKDSTRHLLNSIVDLLATSILGGGFFLLAFVGGSVRLLIHQFVGIYCYSIDGQLPVDKNAILISMCVIEGLIGLVVMWYLLLSLEIEPLETNDEKTESSDAIDGATEKEKTE